jgi:HEAT repeat protein
VSKPGTFKKGQSGNPGGRPKEAAAVKELAREHGPRAISRLAELLEDPDGRTATAAAKELLDRGYGRPAQSITGPNEGPIQVESLVRVYLPDNGREVPTIPIRIETVEDE